MALSDEDLPRRLVAFDSTSATGNLPIADFVCDHVDRPGVTITRNPDGDGSRINVLAGAAHRPNEYPPIDEFRRARSVLDRLGERLC